MNKTFKLNPNFWISTTASLFIHIFIFSIIIFSSPIKFQSQQPYFISLGAILPQLELFQREVNNKIDSKKFLQPVSNPSDSNKIQSTILQFNKPLNAQPLKTKIKTTPKSTFLTADRINKNIDRNIEDIKNELDPYQSLQLP